MVPWRSPVAAAVVHVARCGCRSGRTAARNERNAPDFATSAFAMRDRLGSAGRRSDAVSMCNLAVAGRPGGRRSALRTGRGNSGRRATRLRAARPPRRMVNVAAPPGGRRRSRCAASCRVSARDADRSASREVRAGAQVRAGAGDGVGPATVPRLPRRGRRGRRSRRGRSRRGHRTGGRRRLLRFRGRRVRRPGVRLGAGKRFRRRFGPLACGGKTWLGRGLGRRRWRRALPGRRRSRLTRPRIRPRPSGAELRDIVRGRHRPGGDGFRIAAYRGNGRNEAREDAARRVVRLVGHPPHGARQPAARRLGGWRAPPTMRSHLDVRDGAPPSRRPQRHTSGRHGDDGARATQ